MTIKLYENIKYPIADSVIKITVRKPIKMKQWPSPADLGKYHNFCGLARKPYPRKFDVYMKKKKKTEKSSRFMIG